MARRMEIQLTSKRDDGTWTWRAAGAREPKGTLDEAIVPPSVQVGDVVKVEVEGFLDGISVVSVLPPKAGRSEPERIDLLAPRSEGPLVTTKLARSPRRERPRRDERGDRSDRGDRGDRGDRRRGRGDRERDRNDNRSDKGPRDRDERGDRGDRGDRRERPAAPPVDAKPKPKRLRPAKVHRSALLESLPAEQRPIAEQLLQGGIPAVRQAIEKQNEELKAEGKSQVAADPLIEIAEKLRNKAQAAAWRDRADAALAQVDDLDLRDLRSVVNAAGDAGRDEEARNVADQLRDALIARVEKEHNAWVEEVAENLREARVVRALRLSSRPPKAGSPLPPDLSTQLVDATAAALTSETGPQRWATILDALAYSPIRRRVVPLSLPDKLNAELRQVIARLGSRLPEISHIFDIKPEDAPARPPRGGQQRRGGKGPAGKGDQAESKSKPRGKKRGDRPAKGDADKGEKTSDKVAAEADGEKPIQPPTDETAPEGTESEAPATVDAAAAAPVDEATAANAAGTEETVEATAPADGEAIAAEDPVTEAPAADVVATEAEVEAPAASEEAAAEAPAEEVAASEAPAETEAAAEVADEAPAEVADEAAAEPEASNGHAVEANGKDEKDETEAEADSRPDDESVSVEG